MSNFPHGQSAPEKFKSIGLIKTVGFGYHTYNSALEMSKLAIFSYFVTLLILKPMAIISVTSFGTYPF